MTNEKEEERIWSNQIYDVRLEGTNDIKFICSNGSKSGDDSQGGDFFFFSAGWSLNRLFFTH